ncbi:MAG: hypothetical protein Q7U75_06535, partial [Desulfobacterales bacterium]|nr:hypothetical protein [Desulfobacterales bacterium]
DPELGDEVSGERRRHLQAEYVPRIRESEPDLKRRSAEKAGDPFFVEPPADERFFERDLEGFIGSEQKMEQGVVFAGGFIPGDGGKFRRRRVEEGRVDEVQDFRP